MSHARDFYIPNGRPKVLFMKPFRRDAWDVVVSNDLPPEYDVEVYHGKRDNGYHEDVFTRCCDENVMTPRVSAKCQAGNEQKRRQKQTA